MPTKLQVFYMPQTLIWLLKVNPKSRTEEGQSWAKFQDIVCTLAGFISKQAQSNEVVS
jgi:hypothetical protein